MDDADSLCELIRVTARALPAPKPPSPSPSLRAGSQLSAGFDVLTVELQPLHRRVFVDLEPVREAHAGAAADGGGLGGAAA
jgi:hypothetical protein